MKVLQRTGTESAENTRIKKEQKVDEMQQKSKKWNAIPQKRKPQYWKPHAKMRKKKTLTTSHRY